MERGTGPSSVQGSRWSAPVLLLVVGLQAHAADVSLPLPSMGSEPAVRVPVLIELEGLPAARVFGTVLRGKAGSGGSSRAEAATAARVQVARNRARQAALVPQLVERFGATELYRVSKALNAVVVLAKRKQLVEIADLAGVRGARVLPLEFPSNATSVPFVGASTVWGGSSGSGSPLTGAGVTIGVIDSGVDYIHSDFGGTGNLADYQANDPTAATTPFYPSAEGGRRRRSRRGRLQRKQPAGAGPEPYGLPWARDPRCGNRRRLRRERRRLDVRRSVRSLQRPSRRCESGRASRRRLFCMESGSSAAAGVQFWEPRVSTGLSTPTATTICQTTSTSSTCRSATTSGAPGRPPPSPRTTPPMRGSSPWRRPGTGGTRTSFTALRRADLEWSAWRMPATRGSRPPTWR